MEQERHCFFNDLVRKRCVRTMRGYFNFLGVAERTDSDVCLMPRRD